MKFNYYTILAGVLLLASCNKDLPEVDEPTLEVQPLTATIKAGDAVRFNITGESDIVYFYSGEPAKEYAFRNGRTIDATGAGALMSFTTLSASGSQGTLSATVPPQLSVMASTDFNGKYDYASVTAATWTNITSRFKYWTTGTAFISSTDGDISDLIVAGKPLYIAYKYETKPQAPAAGNGGAVRQWQIEALTLTSKKNIGTTTFPLTPVLFNTVNPAGFRLVDQNPVTAPARSTLTASRVTLYGNVYDAVNDPTNDPNSINWAVSKPIDLNKFDVAPDRAVAIKDQAKESALTSHTYTYAKAGTYKATFVATNNNIQNSKEIVREVVITVTP